jgi:hypothetical protein
VRVAVGVSFGSRLNSSRAPEFTTNIRMPSRGGPADTEQSGGASWRATDADTPADDGFSLSTHDNKARL